MVVRDIKLKYRRSVIGLLWSILNPLLMMVVITAVFQNLFRFEIENFAVYYLTGWVVFNFITEATSGAMTSIMGASALIRKVYIPKYIFPMQKCIFSFVNMLFSLVALFVVMLVLKVEFTWNLLLIPIPLVLALVFSIGLGMILSTVAVFFRDMIHLYGIFTMVWMYLTPIIYPEEILVGAMQTIMKMNPMYYYVDYFRQLTLYGTLPGVESLLVMCGCSVISLLLGVAVFKKKQDRFILFI
ncbi:MAG: ABC transporter permease [Lachnospiraceae bacterium]|nr:ABC transporter permease [Lachnospiraceae bacterium]